MMKERVTKKKREREREEMNQEIKRAQYSKTERESPHRLHNKHELQKVVSSIQILRFSRWHVH